MLLNACKKNEAKIGSVPDLKEQGTELEAILQYQTVLDRMLTREPRTGKQKLPVIISSMQGVPAEDQEGGGTEGRGRKVPSLANWLYTFVVMHKANTDRPDRPAHHWRVLSIDHMHSIEKPTTLSEGSLPLSLTFLSLSLSPSLLLCLLLMFLYLFIPPSVCPSVRPYVRPFLCFLPSLPTKSN